MGVREKVAKSNKRLFSIFCFFISGQKWSKGLGKVELNEMSLDQGK